MFEALLRDYDEGLPRSRSEHRSLVTMEEPDPSWLSAHVPVMSLAAGSVAALCSAVNRYRAALEFEPASWALDGARIAASFSGDRMLRVDGQPVSGFAELSGFFVTSDGWVRTHANYPHHRSRLLSALSLPASTDRDAFAAVVRSRSASDIEDVVTAAGGIAVRVRTEQEWAAGEPGLSAASGPLVATSSRPDARSRTSPDVRGSTPSRPLAGIRVLDLTRVIAGPVATRTLALLGADVVRVDPPELPEIATQFLDVGQGKRVVDADLRETGAAAHFVTGKDVVITGYRPGSLPFVDEVAAADGIVVGRVSAWGNGGPWAHRRGFDSIVQAASGLSLIEGNPGALPAQALDHATGYLLAAGVIDALAGRVADGAGRNVDTALARTAAWLLAAPRTRDPVPATLPDPSLTCVEHGSVSTARPALAEYDDYPFPARPISAGPASGLPAVRSDDL